MYMILSFILIIIGAVMILKPQIVFDLTEGWKAAAGSEPSKLYLFSTRFGGVMFLLAGIGGIAAFLLT